MLRIIDLAFERPVRLISNIAEALGVTYAGAANNVRELVEQGVAEEGTYPKLIRFPGGGGGSAGGVNCNTTGHERPVVPLRTGVQRQSIVH